MTYRDICIKALRTSGAVGLGEIPSDDEIALAIDKLNSLLGSLFIEASLQYNKKTIEFTTRSDGTAYFGTFSNPFPPFPPINSDLFSEIFKAINLTLNTEMKYLNDAEFLNQQINDVSHNYYTFSFIEPELIEFQSSKDLKDIQIQYNPLWKDKVLSDLFDLPQFYLRMIEYGLAAELADFFGRPSEMLTANYKSSLKRIKQFNYTPSILNNRQISNFDNGYGLI